MQPSTADPWADPWAEEEEQLPASLAAFQALEVIGCDSNSLKLYLSQTAAFGVLPEQLVGHGWVAQTPTALVLYQIDDIKVHGLWTVTGRQVANGAQIAIVELVEEFPALEEGIWHELLEYEDEADEDGYIGYKYPQVLDQDKTKSLITSFWQAKRYQSVAATQAGTGRQGKNPGNPRDSLLSDNYLNLTVLVHHAQSCYRKCSLFVILAYGIMQVAA